MDNNIIIAGISGQDGYFLTKKLKQKKLKIIGLSRKKRPYGDANLILKTNYKESHLIKIIKKFKPSIIFRP